ncbi:MAG: hypothetical protein C0592_12040 [Marinilabiliales bacterium]|nr:MAG: hypothetical protein C0592_12040 [Marinilabiliales bacterium]
MRFLFPCIIVLCFLAICSCSVFFGDEFERIPIDNVCSRENCSVESALIDLEKDEEISLWSDYDVEYEGNLQLEYQIVVVIDEKDTLDMMAFDPFYTNVTINSRSIQMNNHYEESAEAKLCDFTARKTGSYEFNVVVFANQKPGEFIFTKGDLVFRK